MNNNQIRIRAYNCIEICTKIGHLSIRLNIVSASYLNTLIKKFKVQIKYKRTSRNQLFSSLAIVRDSITFIYTVIFLSNSVVKLRCDKVKTK